VFSSLEYSLVRFPPVRSLTENQVSVLRDLFEGFHLLGNIDRTEGQIFVLRYLFVDFHLLGNID